MIRKYEACILIDPGLDHSELEEEINNILEILKSSGTNVVHHELWGRRTLMYPIKKKNEGYYYLFHFETTPDTLKKINDGLKHREKVLRTLILNIKEFPEFTKNGESESQ
ncbi:MAG: 30S ribosomal protein S6 [candidate division TA06 bacterium ADurb.Bin131]|jgi:small subunit ribosomal protein S6|uniref:Small ribosomal subunit protein bS6 n=1 Tax=candidate division TA06 bacterium ADurb.Bin131 TaxID=1852827 RepID=A0A1V6CA38_UNCT6|nr:MAG: 30S ribosomal protein S6 [candidate division TA06 bacterium ADurb.Bin131]HON05829.1 30S ribosomal protein S6 [bacterium]HQL65133.1 30S ribosomal protein S6 [bacterium]